MEMELKEREERQSSRMRDMHWFCWHGFTGLHRMLYNIYVRQAGTGGNGHLEGACQRSTGRRAGSQIVSAPRGLVLAICRQVGAEATPKDRAAR